MKTCLLILCFCELGNIRVSFVMIDPQRNWNRPHYVSERNKLQRWYLEQSWSLTVGARRKYQKLKGFQKHFPNLSCIIRYYNCGQICPYKHAADSASNICQNGAVRFSTFTAEFLVFAVPNKKHEKAKLNHSKEHVEEYVKTRMLKRATWLCIAVAEKRIFIWSVASCDFVSISCCTYWNDNGQGKVEQDEM